MPHSGRLGLFRRTCRIGTWPSFIVDVAMYPHLARPRLVCPGSTATQNTAARRALYLIECRSRPNDELEITPRRRLRKRALLRMPLRWRRQATAVQEEGRNPVARRVMRTLKRVKEALRWRMRHGVEDVVARRLGKRPTDELLRRSKWLPISATLCPCAPSAYASCTVGRERTGGEPYRDR